MLAANMQALTMALAWRRSTSSTRTPRGVADFYGLFKVPADDDQGVVTAVLEDGRQKQAENGDDVSHAGSQHAGADDGHCIAQGDAHHADIHTLETQVQSLSTASIRDLGALFCHLIMDQRVSEKKRLRREEHSKDRVCKRFIAMFFSVLEITLNKISEIIFF